MICVFGFVGAGIARPRLLRPHSFLSLFEKEKQQVVVSGGEIVWLVNERIDQRFRVTGQTRRVLLLQVREERSEETSNDLIP